MGKLAGFLAAVVLLSGSAFAQAPAPIAPPSTSSATVNIPASVCNWNGVTGADATAIVQAAIMTASAVNGEVDLPPNPCLISSALIIPANVTIRGQGCFESWGSLTGSFIYPIGGITGGGFVQAAPGTDIIDITGRGITVNLLFFCGQFKAPYINTGDGIAVKPPSVSGYSDHGVIGGIWEGVKILGNDGNHWGFNLTNTLLTTIIGARSYGGGGLRMFNESGGYQYGNLNVQDFYNALYISGTADGIDCDGDPTYPNAPQIYSVFTRPQVWLYSLTAGGLPQPPGTTPPTNSQHLWNSPNGLCQDMTEVFPDFETNITGGTAILPTIRNQVLNGSIAEADTIQSGSHIGNAALTLNPTNSTAYQNLTGTTIQYNLTMLLGTAGAAAVSVYVGPQAADVGNVSWLQSYIGSVTTLSQAQYQTMTFVVPSGFYFGVAFSGAPGIGANASVAAASYVRVPGF